MRNLLSFSTIYLVFGLTHVYKINSVSIPNPSCCETQWNCSVCGGYFSFILNQNTVFQSSFLPKPTVQSVSFFLSWIMILLSCLKTLPNSRLGGGPIYSLSWIFCWGRGAVLRIIESLALSLASTHLMPIALPTLPNPTLYS